MIELPESIEELAPPEPPLGAPDPRRALPLRLGDVLDISLERARRRKSREELPIPLPWPDLEAQLGGGLWPGVHVLVGATGSGKSAWALQIALHAARAGVPVGYVGLELEEMQIALRLLSEVARPPMAWSKLYLGVCSDDELERAFHAKQELANLPIYLEMGSPSGWPASELQRLVESMRFTHPEGHGPGSKPMLLILDFLQIIGDEPDASRHLELRERIGRAAYFARDVARRYGVSVLLISSAARDKYHVLAGDIATAGLSIRFDETEKPRTILERPILRPDVLVGLSKESGEVEYSADSVTVAIRWPEPRIDTGSGSTSVIFATAKGRACGSRWCELRFNGYRFAAATDGGAALASMFEDRQKKGPSEKTPAASPSKSPIPWRNEKRRSDDDSENDYDG